MTIDKHTLALVSIVSSSLDVLGTRLGVFPRFQALTAAGILA